MNWKPIIFKIVTPVAQAIPPSYLEVLFAKQAFSWMARLGLMSRDVTIRHGVASGLKFNAGAYNLETALGTYEMPVQEMLSQYLTPGSVFYDIGANVVFFTVVAAKLVAASGQVYAFEPESENARILRHNIQTNHFDQVRVIEKALSHSTGKSELILDDYCGGHTLLAADTEVDSSNKISVDVIAIDDLLQMGSTAPPTFVKIDVEGA
jgi:FkbM family methyltransferase